jgi:hypothetical protein
MTKKLCGVVIYITGGAQGGGGLRHFGSADRRETIASWQLAYHTTATRSIAPTVQGKHSTAGDVNCLGLVGYGIRQLRQNGDIYDSLLGLAYIE